MSNRDESDRESEASSRDNVENQDGTRLTAKSRKRRMPSPRDETDSIDRASEASSSKDNGEGQDGAGRMTKPGKKQIPMFQLSCYLKEDHGQNLFDCAFNPYLADDEGFVFATVGSCRATIYRCSENGTGNFKPIDSYTDSDNDQFFACTWLYNPVTESNLLAVAGERGVIHAIPFGEKSKIINLVGHGEAINALTTHPMDSTLLLSGGKDYELRLWNVETGVCVAIFGGDGGHKSEVVTCDFDLLGERIASGGLDHCVKIWSILENPRVDRAVQASKKFDKKSSNASFPTVKVYQPDFSSLDVHGNYIDCIRWYGDTLISKSCDTDSTLRHWKPGSHRQLDFSKGEAGISFLFQRHLNSSKAWFIKFALDPSLRWIALGNEVGKINVWDLNALSATSRPLTHSKCTRAVRQVAFSPNGNVLISVCDDSTIWMWMAKKNSKNLHV